MRNPRGSDRYDGSTNTDELVLLKICYDGAVCRQPVYGNDIQPGRVKAESYQIYVVGRIEESQKPC